MANYTQGGTISLLAIKDISGSTSISINQGFFAISSSAETTTKLVGNSILFAAGKLNTPTSDLSVTNYASGVQSVTRFNCEWKFSYICVRFNINL